MAYKNKEIKQKYDREYYLKNKEYIIANMKEYVKKINYRYEKTPEQRAIRYIKRKTRYHFELNGHNCEFCGKPATEHHHNTEPIEFDKFNYICNKCHKDIHKICKEVKNEKK